MGKLALGATNNNPCSDVSCFIMNLRRKISSKDVPLCDSTDVFLSGRGEKGAWSRRPFSLRDVLPVVVVSTAESN
jgi:hypothetical protein